jgi:hypothetical protein
MKSAPINRSAHSRHSVPTSEDAPSVSEYPEVSGMRKRLFWLDHRRPEGNASLDDLATSRSNDYEIDMTAALVNHLV